MAVFRLQDNLPEVYTEMSRDFQLLCRLYDITNIAYKFDIDSIKDITDTNFIDSRLLPLLQTKLGFFSDKQFDNNVLRYILKAFPIMVKNKGSIKGIKQAINVFLKIHKINTNVIIMINDNNVQDPNQAYTIQIGIESAFKDTTALTEMLKYILPVGYVSSVFFYTPLPTYTKHSVSDVGNIRVLTYNLGSQFRAADGKYFKIVDDSVQFVDIKDITLDRTLSAVDTGSVYSIYDKNDNIQGGMELKNGKMYESGSTELYGVKDENQFQSEVAK